MRGHARWWLLFALLLGAAGLYLWGLVDKPARAKNGPIAITATPLVLDGASPTRTELGALHFLGAWQLKGPSRSFGGLSAIHMMPDGQLLAIHDGAISFTFPQPGAGDIGTVKKLPVLKQTGEKRRYTMDSEALVVDPDSGEIWVGFELLHRVCRYSPGFEKALSCHDWPQMKDWPATESIESMARLPDGRFLVISEGAPAEREGREAFLFARDPTDPGQPAPIRMSYVPPAGYNPTDAVWIGDNQLLVLNRRATLYDGFTAIITVVDLSHMKPGALLMGREVARLAPPVLADNFEGLALDEKDGQRILWVISDDNHLFFQRTLLLKFALPKKL